MLLVYVMDMIRRRKRNKSDVTQEEAHVVSVRDRHDKEEEETDMIRRKRSKRVM